jgi:two-component system, LytTR family, sensor kinase
MVLKRKKITAPANLILIASALFLSVFSVLLAKIQSSAHILNFNILLFTSIGLIFAIYFFCWLIFKIIHKRHKTFWITHTFFPFFFIFSYFLIIKIVNDLTINPIEFEAKIYILLFTFFNVFLLPPGFYFLDRKFEKLQKSQDEVEIKKNELEHLKNQLSPHFLFNNLNNIYATIMIDKQIALDYTHKFSDMMRFYHNMIGKNLIPLSEELSYIENYLAIEKYKMGERLRLNFVKKIHNTEYNIPPFLLTPVIETAIERSQGLGAIPYIEIIISIESKKLKLEISNSIPEKPGTVKKQILLDQLRNKLELIYKNNFSLTVEKQKNFEISILILPL